MDDPIKITQGTGLHIKMYSGESLFIDSRVRILVTSIKRNWTNSQEGKSVVSKRVRCTVQYTENNNPVFNDIQSITTGASASIRIPEMFGTVTPSCIDGSGTIVMKIQSPKNVLILREKLELMENNNFYDRIRVKLRERKHV